MAVVDEGVPTSDRFTTWFGCERLKLETNCVKDDCASFRDPIPDVRAVSAGSYNSGDTSALKGSDRNARCTVLRNTDGSGGLGRGEAD